MATASSEPRKLFAAAPPRDHKDREKALAAMVRAGHSFALAREIIRLAPGSEIDRAEIAERARLIPN